MSTATRLAADRASLPPQSHLPKSPAAPAAPDRKPGALRSALLASIERPTRHAQIPIALAAPACLMTRGFLPWRLSDAGPGACLTLSMGRRPKPFTIAEVHSGAGGYSGA